MLCYEFVRTLLIVFIIKNLMACVQWNNNESFFYVTKNLYLNEERLLLHQSVKLCKRCANCAKLNVSIIVFMKVKSFHVIRKWLVSVLKGRINVSHYTHFLTVVEIEVTLLYSRRTITWRKTIKFDRKNNHLIFQTQKTVLIQRSFEP